MQIEKLDLEKTKNMRDMGGIPTADGRKIKHGMLIRSGRLYKLPQKTVAALKSMNIENVIDFRMQREIDEHPPTFLEGVKYYYLPMTPTAPPQLTNAKHMSTEVYIQSRRIKRDFGKPENYMHSMYKFIVTDPDSRQKLKSVFDILVKAENCTVFHCNSGTDRTGICAMLIESVLGVEKDVILQDYMASRTFQLRRRNWQKFGLMVSPVPHRFRKLLFAKMLPKPQYMLQLIDEIEAEYGTVTNYVKEALGVSEDDIKLLKDKYLE